MANGVFNVSKGAVAEKVRDGAAIKVLLLKAVEADDVLNNYATVAALLAVAGNVQCDFSGYAIKPVTAQVVKDDVANTQRCTTTETKLSYDTSVGAVENTIVKAIFFEDTAADDIPLTFHDLNVGTTGTTALDINLPAAWFTAS